MVGRVIVSIADLCLLPYFLVTDKSRVFVPCFIQSSSTAIYTFLAGCRLSLGRLFALTHLGLDTRKHVFGVILSVCEEVILNPACTTTEISLNIECLACRKMSYY